MERGDVLRALSASGEAKALAALVDGGKARRIVADGLCGSSAAMVLAAMKAPLRTKGVERKQKETSSMLGKLGEVLVVMNDADEAGYFYHDLTQMLGEGRVLFFPSSYKRAIKYNQRDAASEVLRTEALSRLSSGDEDVMVVTYPDALAEGVVRRDELDECSQVVSVGEQHDIAALEERLAGLDFERVDYVYEPGQFAVRGGIVDVFSFASEVPYRLDFFGDEVDSIRTFDVESQLSIDKVDCALIVGKPSGDAATTSRACLLEFLSKDALVVARNVEFVCEKIEQIGAEGFSRQAKTEAAAGESVVDERLIIGINEFREQMADFRMLELRHAVTGDEYVVRFDTQPQPLFHKNFDLVCSELRRLMECGYRISIFADSEKQIARLRDIFEEKAQTEADAITFDAVGCAIHEGFVDSGSKRCYFTDHQIFDRYHKYSLKSEKAAMGRVAMTLREVQQLELGDYVVHIDHGVGRFCGLVQVPQGNGSQEMIKIAYLNDDTVYVSIHALHKVSKYKGREGEPPRLNRIGSGAWERMKERVKGKVKDIARDLIRLYAQRMCEKGFAYTKDSYLQHELEASFVYEDTPDQLRATQEVKADMERERPMDRLVCGDVGFGKTEVAIRAAFKAACDGKQVAVMVPTTVLAYQHYNTFSKRLKDFPVTVDYLTRAKQGKKMKETLQGLKDGKTDIVIGTHKLIGKQVEFKDLGLLIIDEEQKFGVAVKERLRQMRVNVDTLTMTATPIPRTLQFSLLGARDLSVIQTPPPNRYPIQTEIHQFSPELLAEAINFEMSRNGQVFIVNDKVSNLRDLETTIRRHVPDARVCIGHGQMPPQELEEIIIDFMNYDYDVMISTTIVENGIDVPNANTIIINNAHHYGLSDIHQMRGRVGRSNRKAFCYLIAPPLSLLNDTTRRRLQAVENFSDLGSGIHIAMQDLDIRGAGNMLGAEQSGFITDLGYETYQKILNEAVAELKESEFSDLFANEDKDEHGQIVGSTFVTECSVESDIAAFFPDHYVPSSSERMSLYREMNTLTTLRQLDDYKARLIDRFGTMPEEGEELLRVMQVKWAAQRLGVEKVVVKGGRMILYFTNDPLYYQSLAFEKVLNFLSLHGRYSKLRDGDRRSLLIQHVSTMSSALFALNKIENK